MIAERDFVVLEIDVDHQLVENFLAQDQRQRMKCLVPATAYTL
jgi:hypothetical protein